MGRIRNEHIRGPAEVERFGDKAGRWRWFRFRTCAETGRWV